MIAGFKQVSVIMSAIITVWLGLLAFNSDSIAGRLNRRPSLAESALALNSGEIEIGIGYLFGHDTRAVDVNLVPPAKGRSRDGDLTLAPSVDLALGITDRIELQLAYDVRYFNPERGESEWGSGDIRLYGKFHLIESSKYLPDMGLRLGVKLPLADDEKGLGTEEFDFLISFLFTKKIGPLIGNLNLGILILGDPNPGKDPEEVFIWAASLLYPVTERVTIVAEAHGHPATNRDGVNDFAEFRLGTTVKLTSYLTWDIAALTAIRLPSHQPASPDWGGTTGITFRF